MRTCSSLLLMTLCFGCGASVDLSSIPFPDVRDLDPAVAKQLGATRAALEAAVESCKRSSELAKVLGESGETYHAHAFHRAAVACYSRAIELQPSSARWRHLLGLVKAESGDLHGARVSLAEALEIASGSVATQVALADVDTQLNDQEAALREYRAALAIDGSCVPALLGIGRALLRAGDIDPAIAQLERALSLQPGATRIHYPLGLAYRAKGDNDQARSHLSEAGVVAPAYPDWWKASVDSRRSGDRLAQNRGTLLFRAGRFEDAKREFEAALAANPENGLAHAHLGATLLRLGDSEGAEQELRRAVRLAPDDVTANYNMGALLARKGDHLEAIECYERALRSDDRSTQTYFNLANALRRTKQWERAATSYAHVIEEEPSNADAHFGRLLSLTQFGRYQQAMDEAKQVAQSCHDTRILQVLARVLAAAPDDGVRNGVAALELAKRLRAQRRTLEHLEVEAMALAECGYYEDALNIQLQLITAARKQERDDLVPALERNFLLYRQRQPSRTPWDRDSL